MGFDGVRADEQLVGNRLVVLTGGDQGEDLLLSLGEDRGKGLALLFAQFLAGRLQRADQQTA